MGWKYIYTKGVPIEAQYLYKKALEMFRLGKPESALKYLKQTMVIAPRYSKALFEMGKAWLIFFLFQENGMHLEKIKPAAKSVLKTVLYSSSRHLLLFPVYR
jgi:hypothetical protein